MLKIYFDNVLINDDAYAGLTNDYKLFSDSFYLGSTACNTFKLKILKSEVSNHPTNVKIEDENTTFHLIVDKVEEEKGFYNYYLVDKMVNFNFAYDAKPLIDENLALEEETYLSNILEDMCLKANIELDYVLTNDIVVNWYDSRIQAREYLSFIAELEGGYACINELGKLTIKQHKQASTKTISVDEVSELIVGERKLITRVVFDNGLVKWEFGDDIGNTLYLNQNNVFITDEVVVENIYNKIVGFEFYTITVPNAPIDSSIKAGDVVTFINDENEYQTIAQYSTSYAGRWVGGYEFNINTEKQEETQILGLYDSVLSIKTEVDRANATLKITAEKADENSIQLNQLTMTVDKVEQTVRTTGGSNQIKDSVGFFGLDESLWIKEGNVTGGYDQSLVGKSVSVSKITIQNGSIRSTYYNIENLLLNSTYTLSFKVINASDTTLKVKLINSVEVVNLEVDTIENLKEYEFSFVAKSDRAYIEIESQSLYSGSSSIVDLMLNLGDKKPWELAKDEMNGSTMQTSSIGTIFRNINADTATLVNSDGFDVRGYRNNQIGDVITKLGKDGVDTNIVKCTEIKRQKLIQKTINSNGREIYIEYIESS